MNAIRRLLDQPLRGYRVLAPLLVALWFLAGVGGDRTASDGGLYRVGATAWAAFGITALLTIVFTVAVVIQRIRRTTAS